MRTGRGSWFALLIGATVAPQLLVAAPGASAGDLKSSSITPAGDAPEASSSRFASGVAHGHELMRALQTPPAPVREPDASIAIILDDLGEAHYAGLRAIELPGPVACAFLPNGASTRAQAELAFARGKEVLVHLPMEPLNHARQYPTSLTLQTQRDPLVAYLRASLAAVPHARGVNNHQGSELTADETHMGWVMAELHAIGGLYFVDSRTTAASVAFRVARAFDVPSTERDVFLDTERGAPAVRAAFMSLIEQAQHNGAALAIGHPYPEVFQLLEQELPRLASYGVRLVPPSTLIAHEYGAASLQTASVSPSASPAARTTLPGFPGSMSAAGR